MYKIQVIVSTYNDFVYTDSDSGSDEECVTREKMKTTAQAVVDAKTKKKPTDDDEPTTKKRR